jgi:hypothetical protein
MVCLVVHLYYLIGVENQLVVLVNWGRNCPTVSRLTPEQPAADA